MRHIEQPLGYTIIFRLDICLSMVCFFCYQIIQELRYGLVYGYFLSWVVFVVGLWVEVLVRYGNRTIFIVCIIMVVVIGIIVVILTFFF